jgi:serine/threonine protein kinase
LPEVGRGGFGIVHKAIRKCDQKELAIKVSMKLFKNHTEKEKQDLTDEIKYMKNLNHPFIVKIIDDFIDPSGC